MSIPDSEMMGMHFSELHRRLLPQALHQLRIIRREWGYSRVCVSRMTIAVCSTVGDFMMRCITLAKRHDDVLSYLLMLYFVSHLNLLRVWVGFLELYLEWGLSLDPVFSALTNSLLICATTASTLDRTGTIARLYTVDAPEKLLMKSQTWKATRASE
jgi:hypothetical protein